MYISSSTCPVMVEVKSILVLGWKLIVDSCPLIVEHWPHIVTGTINGEGFLYIARILVSFLDTIYVH